MARWMPETRPTGAPRTRLITNYKTLFGTGAFNCYLLMLIGGLAGIAVFEACSGVLMGAVLGLSSMSVSILFILPIRRRSLAPGLPAARTNASRR